MRVEGRIEGNIRNCPCNDVLILYYVYILNECLDSAKLSFYADYIIVCLFKLNQWPQKLDNFASTMPSGATHRRGEH